MMGNNIASVDNGIAHSLVGIIDTDLGTKTPSQAFSAPSGHLLEVLEICLDAVVPMCRCDPIHALSAHLRLLSVVGIGFTGFDDLDGKIVQSLEVVRGVSDDVSLDIHEMQVLEDGLFKLGLGRVNGRIKKGKKLYSLSLCWDSCHRSGR